MILQRKQRNGLAGCKGRGKAVLAGWRLLDFTFTIHAGSTSFLVFAMKRKEADNTWTGTQVQGFVLSLPRNISYASDDGSHASSTQRSGGFFSHFLFLGSFDSNQESRLSFCP